MSTVSVVSNSSVEVDSESSNDDASSKDDNRPEQKFVLPNELYKSLLASAVLGKTVLNRGFNLKDNIANLKNNLDALGALKDLKDIKGLTVSSVPAFPRNLALRREDYDEVKRIFFRLSATLRNSGSNIAGEKYSLVKLKGEKLPGFGAMFSFRWSRACFS